MSKKTLPVILFFPMLGLILSLYSYLCKAFGNSPILLLELNIYLIFLAFTTGVGVISHLILLKKYNPKDGFGLMHLSPIMKIIGIIAIVFIAFNLFYPVYYARNNETRELDDYIIYLYGFFVGMTLGTTNSIFGFYLFSKNNTQSN